MRDQVLDCVHRKDPGVVITKTYASLVSAASVFYCANLLRQYHFHEIPFLDLAHLFRKKYSYDQIRKCVTDDIHRNLIECEFKFSMIKNSWHAVTDEMTVEQRHQTSTRLLVDTCLLEYNIGRFPMKDMIQECVNIVKLVFQERSSLDTPPENASDVKRAVYHVATMLFTSISNGKNNAVAA